MVKLNPFNYGTHNMTNRYEQLLDLVKEAKPRIIVEIGVHRAARAGAMCGEALKHSPKVHYIGFDVFETMNQAFHDAAMNGKGIPTQAQARAVLDKVVANSAGRFTYEFRVGDTRETLHGKNCFADFAFIDGDHRVEAILADFAALNCPVIAMDDYLVPGPNGECPDLKKYGANAAAQAATESGFRVEILPVADMCRHGGYAKIAVARK